MKQKIIQVHDVETLTLLELSSLIIEGYSKDKSSISGSVFALFTKQLLAAETKAGGPYRDKTNSSETMPKLNLAIGRLFLLMGHPLPNVDTYLASLDRSQLTPDTLADFTHYDTLKMATATQYETHPSSDPYRLAHTTITSLEEPIKTQALQFLKRVEAADSTKEIAHLAHFSAQALHLDIDKDILNTLGEANIHGWIAYMIYDHIIDHEANGTMLPIANMCMRLSLDRYTSILPSNHPLHSLVARYFDQVDSASAWELAYCRFETSETMIHINTLPDYQQYKQLAKRTLIHIIGPIIVASRTTPAHDSQQLAHLASGLEQYLIAKQLSDDIHDWREDLAAGRISAVVAYLLRHHEVQPSTSHSIATLTSSLQEHFLRQLSKELSELIVLHAKSARESLLRAGCDATSELAGLTTRLENIAMASIAQQSRFLEFQKEYR